MDTIYIVIKKSKIPPSQVTDYVKVSMEDVYIHQKMKHSVDEQTRRVMNEQTNATHLKQAYVYYLHTYYLHILPFTYFNKIAASRNISSEKLQMLTERLT